MRLPLPAVKRLLDEARLPVADLTEAHLENFLGRNQADELEGVVGLELSPPIALLRSLAVVPSVRGRGVGRALLADAEQYARDHEVKDIYLLTTTAERFFARAGYERVARESAPREIQETQEFSTLCPTTSTVMRKRL